MCELLFVQIVEWSFLLPLKYLLSLDLYVFLINQNFDIQNIYNFNTHESNIISLIQ